MPLTYRCFRNKLTGQLSYVPAGRYGNFLNSIRKLVNFVRYNMPRYYVAHLTLTVAENISDIDFKHLHRTMTFIETRLKRAGSQFEYIAVKECQERGAVHYHVLCVYDKPYVFPSSEDVSKSWKLGFVKITAPKVRLKMQKVASYIGKYIGKGYEYQHLDNKKSFTASQVKQIYKLTEERLASVMDRFGKGVAEGFKCTYRKIFALVDREKCADYETCKKFSWRSPFPDCNKIRLSCLCKKKIFEFPSEWNYEGVCQEPF